MHLVRVL